jgi:heat shock protein HslJ
MKTRWIGAAVAMALAACAPTTEPQELTGRWDVQQIAGAPLGEGVDIWIEIDQATGAVSGFTGCNTFTSTLASYGVGATFAPPQEADGACASDEATTDETRFVMVLPSVRRFIRNGRSLELLPAEAGSEALLRLRLTDGA